jgi:hypothetical protein
VPITDRPPGRDDTATGFRIRTGGGPGFRAADLLPIVRAAMTRGEGPPAVLAWVRTHPGAVPPRPVWTPADEERARALAHRLADRLNDRGGGDPVVEERG